MADYSEDQIIDSELGAMTNYDTGALFYDKVLNEASNHWDVDPIELQGMLDKIAYHESAHSMQSDIKQLSGGPGRGLFQFEVGEGQGGATAGNRLINFLKKEGSDIPDWLGSQVGASGLIDSLDASKLSPEQQKMLFLGNYRMHPDASLKGVNEGNLGDFWAKYHWAGPEYQKEERIASFEKCMKDYDGRKKNA